MTKYIYVDQFAINQGRPDPIIILIRRVPDSNEFINVRATDVLMHGLVRVRTCPNNPAPFGARVWLETEGAVLYKSSELLDYQRMA